MFLEVTSTHLPVEISIWKLSAHENTFPRAKDSRHTHPCLIPAPCPPAVPADNAASDSFLPGLLWAPRSQAPVSPSTCHLQQLQVGLLWYLAPGELLGTRLPKPFPQDWAVQKRERPFPPGKRGVKQHLTSLHIPDLPSPASHQAWLWSPMWLPAGSHLPRTPHPSAWQLQWTKRHQAPGRFLGNQTFFHPKDFWQRI